MKLLLLSSAITEEWTHLDRLFAVLAVLYTGVFLSVIVDWVVGVRRARKLKIMRTSYGYRRTITKLTGYFGLMMMFSITDVVASVVFKMPYFSVAGAIGIVLVEAKSVFENLKQQEKNIAEVQRLLLTFSENKEEIKPSLLFSMHKPGKHYKIGQVQRIKQVQLRGKIHKHRQHHATVQVQKRNRISTMSQGWRLVQVARRGKMRRLTHIEKIGRKPYETERTSQQQPVKYPAQRRPLSGRNRGKLHRFQNFLVCILRIPRRFCHPCYLSFARVQHHRKIITRWAPPAENTTAHYSANVEKWSGIPRNQPLTAADGAAYQRIVAAMSRVENGIPADIRQIKAGFALQHKLGNTF